MSYEFTNKRCPKSAKELTVTQRERLVLAWEFYAGEVVNPDTLVEENSEWFELWSVQRDDKSAFDYWHLPPDSGTLFYAGEAAPTGIRVIQFGWDVTEDVPTRPGVNLASLAEELSEAWRRKHEA